MKNLLKRLQPEDIVALIFSLITLTLFILKACFSGVIFTGIWTSYYFFLIPFLLLTIKESISFFFDSNPAFSGFIRIFRDWFPFLLILGLYYSFYDGLNYFISHNDMDHLLAKADEFLFGVQPSVFLEPLTRFSLLVSWSSFAYLSFIFIPPFIAFYLYFKKEYFDFKITMLAAMFLQAIGCIGYILIPAIGPGYAFPEWYSTTISGSSITHFTKDFINTARITRDCFPSLHAGLSALFFFSLFKNHKKMFFLLIPLILSLWFSCVFLRYHYLVDIIAGIMLAFISRSITYRLFSESYRRTYG